MRLVCLTAVVVLMVPGVFAQHVPHPATRPAPKAKGGASGGMQAPHRASDQQIDTLEKMTPAARQKALEALPPDRRQKIEARLVHLQKLTPDERAQLRDRLEKFNNLSPGQQKEVRQLAQKVRALPDNRRPVVKRELEALRNLPEAERESRVNSPEFKKKFSGDEQEILRQSSNLLPDQF
jgi:hypothetical protein